MRAIRALRTNRLAYLMLLPAILLTLMVRVYPFLSGLRLSLTDYNLLRPQATKFVGLANYVQLLHDQRFWHALWITVIYSVTSVVISYVIGLALALLLNRAFRGRSFLRSLLLLPWALPVAVTAVTFRWLLNDQSGLINTILLNLRIIDEPIQFFATPGMAMFTVILVKIWRNYPFMMVSLLAGLQTIDQELFEAAQIDGADKWNLLRYIIWPALIPVTVILLILQFIYAVNDFETIWLLTKGGPARSTETLVITAYQLAFNGTAFGYAASITVVMLILLFFIGQFFLRWQSRAMYGR